MKMLSPLCRLKTVLMLCTCILTNACIGQNLVVNGDFSAGNTGFTTTNNYCNTADCLYPYVNNAYSIGPDPNFFHHLFFGFDHTTGTGNMMSVNGGLVQDVVWKQSVSVASSASYSFSAWACSIFTMNTAVLGFSINGVNQGTLAAPSALNTWQPFSVLWNSGTATTANITIRALNTSVPLSQAGIDFGLDDIAFSPVLRTSVSSPGSLPVIQVFPNPVTDVLRITTGVPCTITLQDATGRKIGTHTFQQGHGEVDMAAYAAGIYFLVTTINDASHYLKIIKPN